MDEVQKSLKQRYAHLHPVLFERCLEKAKTNGELFDMLEAISKGALPLVWNELARQWETTDNLLQKIN